MDEPTTNVKPDFRKGAICGIENCRSKRYYEENGLTFCKNGHEQHGKQTIRADEDEYSATRGRKFRQQREVQDQVARIYSGPQALELYLQAYQLILRKQSWTLVHVLHLPGEIELIMKDLWELRLQLLADRLKTGVEKDVVHSSQQQRETETRISRIRKKWDMRGKESPRVSETLALCYMAMTILRVPISLGDLYLWAMKETIPFIRVIREVPKTIRDKLPANYIGALDTQVVTSKCATTALIFQVFAQTGRNP